MSIVNSIETVRDWLTAEVCPLVKLKLPDDKATDASYPYKLVNPAAFSLFVPSKDRTPPNIAAPIPSVCVQLVEGDYCVNRHTSRDKCPQRQDPAPLFGVGSRLSRARHLQAERRRQRLLRPAIQRGRGGLLREERRGLA